MSERVTRLVTASAPVMPVDEELVRMLKAMLGRAEAGEIQGAAIATLEADGAGSLVSCGSTYGGAGLRQNVHAALGAVEALRIRMANQLLEW